MAEAVSVFEVGPRDGLQNEPRLVSLADKLRFILDLAQAGVRDIEIGAFVRTDRVPQMADVDLLYARLSRGAFARGRAHAWSMVPNLRGLERAQACDVKRIAVFTAASETFNRRNIGMSIRESLGVIQAVVSAARDPRQGGSRDVEIRAYVSTVFGCPFEGKVSPARAMRLIERLAALGIDQISIGDTIGVGTPNQVDRIVKPAFALLGRKGLAVHFHDTRGTALANTLRALELGVRTVDSSAGGLGGCPFAPGATGNLATEDLVYMLHGMGMRTGIDLDRLCRASLRLASRMKRLLSSRYLQAFASGSCRPI
jgi:hydroxymethylglutaryl-CoA lyase